MQSVLSDLRSLRATTNFPQKAIADRMGVDDNFVSRVLNGNRTLPADFEARFRQAVQELAEEKARADRDKAEREAQALLRAAGVTEEGAVAA